MVTKKEEIKVVTLLGKYEKWLEDNEIAFLKGKGNQKGRSEVLGLVRKLKARFKKAEDDSKSNGGDLSEYLNWYETHTQGRELWEKLVSYALRDIDSGTKGNSKLFDFVKAATEFEDLLYGLEKYYRDHTVHSLWVYLIGEYILRELVPDIGADLNWYLYNDIEQEQDRYPYPKDFVKYSVEKKETRLVAEVSQHRDAIWCVIALCHDLGYSVEKLNKLNKKVEKVLGFFDISDFRHVGYSLDVEHQYLMSQCLEIMAMDVRIVPSEDYEELEDLKLRGEAEYQKAREENKSALKKLKKKSEGEHEKTQLERKRELQELKKTLAEQYEKAMDEKSLVKCYRDDSTYWQLCGALERKEHGVLSSFLLYKIVSIFAESWVRGPGEEWGLTDEEGIENIIRGDILFAIAQHTFDFAYLDEFGSLADILILADELEEFSRLGRDMVSREYHDTTATAEVEFKPSRPKPGEDIEIEIHYKAGEHLKGKKFYHYFWRKARRLCRMYSLEPLGRRRRGASERSSGHKKACGIKSIKMIVAGKDANDLNEELWLHLCRKDKDTKAFLPPKEGSKGKRSARNVTCYEDTLSVIYRGKEVPLDEWLGIKLKNEPG